MSKRPIKLEEAKSNVVKSALKKKGKDAAKAVDDIAKASWEAAAKVANCKPVPEDTEEMWEEIKKWELVKLSAINDHMTRIDEIAWIRKQYRTFFDEVPSVKVLLEISDHLKRVLAEIEIAIAASTWEQMKADEYIDIFNEFIGDVRDAKDDTDLFYLLQEYEAIKPFGEKFEQLALMAKSGRLHEIV